MMMFFVELVSVFLKGSMTEHWNDHLTGEQLWDVAIVTGCTVTTNQIIHRSSRSTTLAFCVIGGFCCATDTSSNSRRPSVLCCGGKNLEQSSVRSDVISDTVDI